MKKHVLLMLSAWGLSFIVAALIIPDLFIFHHISFVAAHDLESPFHNTFALINQWSNGGMSIFNRYDQSSMARSPTAFGDSTL